MTRPTILVMLATAAGCATAGVGPGPAATADIRNPAGETVATAMLVQDGDDVEIEVHAIGIPAGVHGIHLHETGTCTAPDFTSAGGHFNPASREHGFENPAGPHAGDLRNMQTTAGGMGHYTAENGLVTLQTGAASLFDADGTAIVIHAGPDDYRTDPTGDSGARIACGVVVRR